MELVNPKQRIVELAKAMAHEHGFNEQDLATLPAMKFEQQTEVSIALMRIMITSIMEFLQEEYGKAVEEQDNYDPTPRV